MHSIAGNSLIYPYDSHVIGAHRALTTMVHNSDIIQLSSILISIFYPSIAYTTGGFGF